MSAGEPFARVLPEGEDGDPIKVGPVTFYCAYRHTAMRYARQVNTAVSARERAAAERALRDLAEAWAEARAEEEPWTTGFGLREAVERLRSRADAIRDGRAT